MSRELDDETADGIVAGVRRGLPWASAAVGAGVYGDEFAAWMARAEAGEPPYLRLRARLDLADAAFEGERLAVIQRAASNGDRGAAAWLRRRGFEAPAPASTRRTRKPAKSRRDDEP